MNKRVYTKAAIDNMLCNFKPLQAKYELRIVPKEYVTHAEVELNDGFVIAKTDNIISTSHNFTQKYIIEQLEKQAPEIMCAAESTFIDEIELLQVIDEAKNPPIFRSSFQGLDEGCL